MYTGMESLESGSRSKGSYFGRPLGPVVIRTITHITLTREIAHTYPTLFSLLLLDTRTLFVPPICLDQWLLIRHYSVFLPSHKINKYKNKEKKREIKKDPS